MTAARSIRSNAVPAGRERDAQPRHERPALSVVTGHRQPTGLGRVAHWARNRHTTTIRIVCATGFLVASLVISLIVTTLMVQNSFTASEVKSNIAQLVQDIDDDQARLDHLEASLPQQAQDMGMVPQQGSISIDLSGYDGGSDSGDVGGDDSDDDSGDDSGDDSASDSGNDATDGDAQ